MNESDLWKRMWGETKFVPAGSSEEKLSDDEDRISELERRVRKLEIRLNKLTNIQYKGYNIIPFFNVH